ncbi:hypothetical protein QQ045_029185 [Rhodiola kirilowii]
MCYWGPTKADAVAEVRANDHGTSNGTLDVLKADSQTNRGEMIQAQNKNFLASKTASARNMERGVLGEETGGALGWSVTFDNRLFIFKPWSKTEDYKCGSIDALPVRVRLPGIKAHIANSTILSLLCSKLGKPICTNGMTVDATSYNYARVYIEVHADVEFQDSITYEDPYGNCYVQSVIYEWKPSRCSNCCSFGHLKECCPEPNLEKVSEEMKRHEQRMFKQLNKLELDENEDECVKETPGIAAHLDNYSVNTMDADDLCSIMPDT